MYWLKQKLLYTLIIGSLAIIPYAVSGEGSQVRTQITEKESDEIAQRRGYGYRGRRYYRGYGRPYYRGYRPYRSYRWGYPRYYHRPGYRYYRPYRYYYNDPYYYYGPRSGVYLQFRL